MAGEQAQPPSGRLVGVRLALGIAQGALLYLLYSAFDAKTWPATDPNLFAPLLLVALFVPLIAIQGAGNLRAPTLIAWMATAAAVIAAAGWYDIWRGLPTVDEYHGSWMQAPRILPSPVLCIFLGVALFIAHALIVSADADRRGMARYATEFDVTWKMGVRVALAVAFVAAFWLVLWLGANLFALIKLDFFERLIEHRWFAIPATTLATAMALHVSDARAGLVRGVRSLALVLLSWLLALIGAGFLASLFATGLAPLWATKRGAQILLTAAAVLVVLVNAAYQDGDEERAPSLFFSLSIRAASLLLLPIVALAAYAVWLRVAQYGWTTDRVSSVACIVVAAAYALGYAAAVFAPRLIARVNFVVALLVVAVLVALFSPLADPARIAVADQMARLERGKVSAENFDYGFLRFNAGRFGLDALGRLAASGPQAARPLARNALDVRFFYELSTPKPDLEAQLSVYPAGKRLPDGFARSAERHEYDTGMRVTCIYARMKCDAILLDADGDGRDEVLLGENAYWALFHRDKDGEWRVAATLVLPTGCNGVKDALRGGELAWQAPAPSPWRDVVLGGRRFAFDPAKPEATCP